MSEKAFVRKSSGLLRQIGLLENFSINYGAVPISSTLAIYVSWVLWRFPGADVPLSFILAVIVCALGQTLTYAFLSACMPRSGGEYIFQSRILHPALGFASNAIIWYGSSGMLIANFGLLFVMWLASGLSIIGFFSKNPGLIDFSVFLMEKIPFFIIGTIFIVVTAVLALISTKVQVRTQVICMFITIIGILIGWGFVLFTTRESFINLFNQWMSPYAPVSDVYHYVIEEAQNLGFYVPQISLSATVMALGIHFLWSAYFQWSTYSSGEFREASSVKRQVISMLGAQVFVGIFCAFVSYSLINVAGREFLASVFYLYNMYPQKLPLPIEPSINMVMTLCAGGSSLIATIITVAFLASMVQLILVCYLMASRCLFAWAFDGVAPKWLADVHPRFGTPWKAITLVAILSIAYLAAYTWAPPWFYMYVWTASYFAQIIITFLFTGVAAVVFSTSKKWRKLYETSPAKKYEIAGIPLMTVFGVISVITMLIFACIYLSDPSYGVTWDFGIPYNIAMIAVPLIIFYAVRAYRRRQGINIDLAFKEIPPE